MTGLVVHIVGGRVCIIVLVKLFVEDAMAIEALDELARLLTKLDGKVKVGKLVVRLVGRFTPPSITLLW